MQKRETHILIVEDNPGDLLLIKEAISGIPGVITTHASDGEQALQRLGLEPYRNVAIRRPDLVLLDLHLPKLSGHHILREIRRSPDLRSTRVIIMSSSTLDEDIRAAYKNRADGYLHKPSTLDEFLTVFACCVRFWTAHKQS